MAGPGRRGIDFGQGAAVAASSYGLQLSNEDVMTQSDLITAAGAAMLVGAALSAEMAWLAARGVANLGVLCGSAGQPHCPWLIAAAVLLASGAATLIAGRRRAKPAAVPSR
jgi:hypothetical protein